jgi:uncharacterized membrane protein
MAAMSDRVNSIRSSGLALIGVLALALSAGLANAQTQASCQFNTFNTRSYVNGNYRTLFPLGVNDYNTVVGDRMDDSDFSVRGFTRLSNGSITYYQHNSTATFFTDRTNDGVTIGRAGDRFAPGDMRGTPFSLKGSTFTPLTITVNGKTYNKFAVSGRNRYETIVGIYPDASANPHGFKRFSDGHTIAIEYPGAAETRATAINDNGTIVGSYSNFLPDNVWWHGFIYNNGKWATLDFPGKQTQLSGVSNSNLIVGNTVAGRDGSLTETGAFMYQNGTFKRIVLPNNVPTSVRGTSANKSLITGASGNTGFIATCK